MRNLKALAMFAKVVEAKSFSAAARSLSMPVAAVRRRIAHLEAQLGVRLLERCAANFRLTAVGIEVLEQARRSAALGEALDRAISRRALAAARSALRASRAHRRRPSSRR